MQYDEVNCMIQQCTAQDAGEASVLDGDRGHGQLAGGGDLVQKHSHSSSSSFMDMGSWGFSAEAEPLFFISFLNPCPRNDLSAHPFWGITRQLGARRCTTLERKENRKTGKGQL